jgi:hypothetical protein
MGNSDDNNKAFALLKTRLMVPMIARDYIENAQELDAASAYGLHEVMSELSATRALVCTALTLKEISCPDLTYIQEICSGILSRHQALNEPETIGDLLHLEAEIEQLLELMEMCRMADEILKPEAAIFLDIMIPQMEAQSMIVGEALRLKTSGPRPDVSQMGTIARDLLNA